MNTDHGHFTPQGAHEDGREGLPRAGPSCPDQAELGRRAVRRATLLGRRISLSPPGRAPGQPALPMSLTHVGQGRRCPPLSDEEAGLDIS